MSSSLPTSETPATLNLALLRCAAGTDVGMRREENQDCFGIIKRPDFQAFFVADGMGGAQGGATASRMAIGTLQDTLNQPETHISLDSMTSVVESINRKIYDKGSADPSYAGMGTTLVGLVFTSSSTIVMNVGDSRAYRVRHQNIEQISKDHTLLGELISSGTIEADDARGQSVSHMLTRSLGPLPDVEVESRILAELPENGDIYVLCSDGLTNYVPPEDILAVVRQNPLDDASQILINLANQRGGGDNITVLLIAVGERTPRTRKPTLPFPPFESESPQTIQEVDETSRAVETRVAIPQPPPVEEPKDLKAARKALRERQRVYGGPPPAIPTFLLLAATLGTGLFIGSVARKASLFGFEKLADIYPDYEAPARNVPQARKEVQEEVPSLAALARQIRSERMNDQDDPQASSGSSRKPEQIRASISRLQQQIQALKTEPINSSSDNTEQIRAEVDRLQKDYSTIESNLDVASRAVTLWLSRQVAFENQKKSGESLAEIEQVAAYSVPIKEKLAALSAVSYQYRSKADEVELYPGNQALRADFEALQAKRDQLRDELQIDVRKALGNILANTYKDYETIKIKRDILWLDLQSAKRELEVQTTLADSDQTKRGDLIRSLEDRLATEQRELIDTQQTRAR
jgi:serine/threonine protein phosphatase PrpC